MLNIILTVIYFTGCSFWFLSIFSNKVGRGGGSTEFGGGDRGFIGKGGILSIIIFIGWLIISPILFTFSINFLENIVFNLIIGLIIGLPLGRLFLRLYEDYTYKIYNPTINNLEGATTVEDVLKMAKNNNRRDVMFIIIFVILIVLVYYLQ